MSVGIKITLTSSIYVLILAVFFGVFQFQVEKCKQVTIQNITQENTPELVQDIYDYNGGNQSNTIAQSLANFQSRIIFELTFKAIINETLDYVSSLMFVWSFFSTLGDSRLDATNITWTLVSGFGSFLLLSIVVSYLAITFFYTFNKYFEASLGMADKGHLDADSYVLRFKKKKGTTKNRENLYDPVLERDKLSSFPKSLFGYENNRRSIVNRKIAHPKDFTRFAAVHGWTRMEPMSSGLFMGLFVMIFPVIVSVFFCLFFEEKNYMENLIESIFFIFTIRAPDALMQESQAWYEVLILTACSSIGAILVTSMVWRVSYDLIIGLSWFGSDERALYNMRNP